MELFKGRTLCLLCFFFMLGSVCAIVLSKQMLPYAMAALLLFAILFLVGSVLVKSHRGFLVMAAICWITVLCAVAHSFLWIALPQRKAAQYRGEHAALCYIVSVDERYTYSSRYEIRLLMIDEEEVDIRGVLACSFQAELSPGDRVAARVNVRETAEDSNNRKNGLLLIAYLDDEEEAYVQRMGEDRGLWETLCSKSGIRIVANGVQKRLGDRFSSLLGEEAGALASGFLMGDRSRIASDVQRDFRRSGTSHQMAVSGLHITVLLGTIELLLRKLYVHKSLRCIVITLLSVFFLFMTGFSLSACRSVLMLYAVYMSYVLMEDNDALTSLFFSITLIILVSPYSVYDLGMWMSFLATLGLLTVYPLCAKLFSGLKKGRTRWQRRALRFCRKLLLASCMTVIANLFLLPISWLFFGEISLVAVPSNLLLSPLAYVFLIGALPTLVLGSVPFLGNVMCAGMSWLSTVIIKTVSLFSHLRGATLSLNYPFAGAIVVLFAVSWAILLVIRLSKKWILVLPPLVATVAFALCMGIYHGAYEKPTLTYSYSRGSELMTVSEGAEISFCDLSYGSMRGYSMLRDELYDTRATEIRSLILTHYHKGHRAMLELCTQNKILHTLYLPVPQDQEEAALSKELWELAREADVEVRFYETSAGIQLTDSVRMRADHSQSETCPAVSISFYSMDTAYSYTSPGIYGTGYGEQAERQMKNSRVVLFGSHGFDTESSFFFDLTEATTTERIVYTSDAVRQSSRCRTGDLPVYAPSDSTAYRLVFSFE